MTQEVKKNLGTVVKVACLCIIMFQYAKSFSTPAIAAIGEAYPMIDSVMLKQIESIPSLMAIPGAFCVGLFERFMKKKTMLWIAMLCTLLGGVVAGFMPETVAGFYGILACRIVLGFGRGMIFPMASSFIADLFTGNTRDKLMSFKTASGGLAGALFQVIGGFLAVMSWRYAFIGYLFIIPIIILCAVGIPEPNVKPPAKKKAGEGATLGLPVWILIIIAMLYNIFQFSIFTNMALSVAGTGIGNPAVSGTILSTLTFATAAGAIIYGIFLKGRFRGFDIPIAMTLCAIGFYMLTTFISMEMYYVAVIVFGFGFGIFNPALILQCVKLVPRESATLSLSILAAMQNLGQYLSAYVLAFLAPLFGAGAVYAQLAGWEVSWPICFGFAVVVAGLIIFLKSKKPELVAGMPEPKKISDGPNDSGSGEE